MAGPPTDAFLAALERDFPRAFLSLERDDLEVYGRDAAPGLEAAPSAVARPSSTPEVSQLLARCHDARVAVVPSGGRTGLAGGAVAQHGELVLSLSRMRALGAVDIEGATVEVQAGVTTQEVHVHTEPHGLTWPIDLASKGSSHVGGNIATNAGGVLAVRYGVARSWVLGLQVVCANGQVLDLNGALEKNNTGLDLRQLFIGSEGILGVITAATLKLTPLPGALTTLLVALPDVAAALTLLAEVRRCRLHLSSFELFTERCLEVVLQQRKLRAPFDALHPCYVLMELEDAEPAQIERWTESLLGRSLIRDGVLAQDRGQAAALWQLRESISESFSAAGLVHKNDIALPIARLAAFCAELTELVRLRYPGWDVALFGHVGDGNLHINVRKPEDLERERFLQQTREVDHALFALVRAHGGSISAEHGVGLLKKRYLGYTRTSEEIDLMRAIKRTLDPHGILNPGKVIESAPE